MTESTTATKPTAESHSKKSDDCSSGRIQIDRLQDHQLDQLIEELVRTGVIYGSTSLHKKEVRKVIQKHLNPRVDRDLRKAETDGLLMDQSGTKTAIFAERRANPKNRVEPSEGICFSAKRLLKAHHIEMSQHDPLYVLIQESLCRLSIRVNDMRRKK